MNLSLIKSIAKECREWAESVADVYDSDSVCLDCMCAITSYEIFLTLKEKGIRAKFCMNNHHCFVMVDDYVIDITAKQFSRKAHKIIVDKKENLFEITDWDGNSIWTVLHSTEKPERIRGLMKDWPIEQQPLAFQPA